jgi:hypothetical protein
MTTTKRDAPGEAQPREQQIKAIEDQRDRMIATYEKPATMAASAITEARAFADQIMSAARTRYEATEELARLDRAGRPRFTVPGTFGELCVTDNGGLGLGNAGQHGAIPPDKVRAAWEWIGKTYGLTA